MAEVITRACGHSFEFVPKGDKFDDARREKWVRTNCPACGKAKNEADNRRAQANRPPGSKVRKGKEVKMLPAGTRITLVRREDGSWTGSIEAGTATVAAETTGLMSLVNKLARQVLRQSGLKLEGKH